MGDNYDRKLSDKDRQEWLETYKKLNEMRTNQENGIRTKMVTKIKSNPFVPIGMFATCIALSLGLIAMKNGNKKRSQLMMRARIGAQGFTVVALLLGIVVAGTKTKPA